MTDRRFIRVATGDEPCDGELVLAYDIRKRSRFRARMADGTDAGVVLPRGTVLRDGDRLVDEAGVAAVVVAAAETVSRARSEDAHALARACYHLGNRHVALEIREREVRYQHDHVLDDMVRGLGLEVAVEQAPFEPEPGAYGGGGHHHHHHDHEDEA